MRLPHYDFIQYHMIKLRKEKFHEKLSFFRLYIYMIKNLHPILSIFTIYDPHYNRKVRTLDFFLNIYLTFFFTLFPYYAGDNPELTAMAANRSIQNRNKGVNDLKVQFNQVINF